jgi:hypothetical protein
MTTPRHRPWEEAIEFTIGLKPIPIEAWLEGGEADPAARKDPLYANRRGLVWAEAERSREGQAEAASLIEEALGPAPAPLELPPLFAASRRVADDLCLIEKSDGQWRLTAPSLRTAHPDLRAYKRFDLYDDLVEAFLRQAGVTGDHLARST